MGDGSLIETVALWRPTGEKELLLIRESGMRRFPPRLPEQPIFYPVLNFEYAQKIARDWNSTDARHGAVGYVTQFDVRRDYLDSYEPQQVGGRTILEYWIPAEDLEGFNDAIVGQIRVIATYRDGHRVKDWGPTESVSTGPTSLRYLRTRWSESPGPDRDWGASTWLYKLDANGEVLEQFEIYESGPVLHYDEHYIEDEFGFLATERLDREAVRAAVADFGGEFLDADKYQRIVSTLRPTNR